MIYGEGSAVYRSNVKHSIWTHCNFLSCFVKPIYRATVSVKLEGHHIGGVMVGVLECSRSWVRTPFGIQQFSAISWREQVNFQWDDNEIRFELDQYVELDFYSTSSLKQQSTDRPMNWFTWYLIPIIIYCSWMCILWKESLDSGGHQFH
jgi:hypothetical protein